MYTNFIAKTFSKMANIVVEVDPPIPMALKSSFMDNNNNSLFTIWEILQYKILVVDLLIEHFQIGLKVKYFSPQTTKTSFGRFPRITIDPV